MTCDLWPVHHGLPCVVTTSFCSHRHSYSRTIQGACFDSSAIALLQTTWYLVQDTSESTQRDGTCYTRPPDIPPGAWHNVVYAGSGIYRINGEQLLPGTAIGLRAGNR